MNKSFDELSESEQKPYLDLARSILRELLWCKRGTAWRVGGLLEDDFVEADADSDIVLETAKEIYEFVMQRQAQ